MTLEAAKAAENLRMRMADTLRALEGPTCIPYSARFITPNADGPGTISVSYGGQVVCNFYLSGAVQAYLIDRTNGAYNNGYAIHNANPYYFYDDYTGTSSAVVTINGNIYDGARQAEVGFAMVLQTLDGTPWSACYRPLPNGQRYLQDCEGLGTDRISLQVGSGEFSTGLPAFNPAASILTFPAIQLATSHTGGVDPPSTARQNIVDAAAGLPARTSAYSDVGATLVNLDAQMLRGMLWIYAYFGYNYYVTEVAGGDHSTNSRHYRGLAFDVGLINGTVANAANPNVQGFKDACRTLGANEILGPGDPGHNTHVHCAW